MDATACGAFFWKCLVDSPRASHTGLHESGNKMSTLYPKSRLLSLSSSCTGSTSSCAEQVVWWLSQCSLASASAIMEEPAAYTRPETSWDPNSAGLPVARWVSSCSLVEHMKVLKTSCV